MRQPVMTLLELSSPPSLAAPVTGELPHHAPLAPLNPKANFEKMTQIMFEASNMPDTYIRIQFVLSLYASGRTSFATLIMVSPTWYPSMKVSLFPTLSSVWTLLVVTSLNYLSRIMTEKGYSFITTADCEIGRDIKEKLCYIALDFESEMNVAAASSSLDKSYEISDGQVITISSERFRAPSLSFSLLSLVWILHCEVRH
ncbi:actin-like [Palaemon carinicauda]|uniref:actin-like n=1 Tax=Palaemon carinicauda TaxID=392227 RepID=UPI0035B5F427